MTKLTRYWTCTACGETVINEPMVVLKHQMSHTRRRPFAGTWSNLKQEDTRKSDENES
jgi:hypothetical protein